MRVSATTVSGGASAADTVAIGLLEGTRDGVPEPAAAHAGDELPAEAAALIASGEARSAFKALALAHAGGRRWLLVGCGKRADLTPERARVLAAAAHRRALEAGTRTLCWQAPLADDPAVCAALVEGTMLADYRFTGYRSEPADPNAGPHYLEALIVATGAGRDGTPETSGSAPETSGESAPATGGGSAPATGTGEGGTPETGGDEGGTPATSGESAPTTGTGERGTPATGGGVPSAATPAPPAASPEELQRAVEQAAIVAHAANAARDLQNRPANDLTPTALAHHARALADEIEGLSVESEDRAGLLERGMGAFAAVAQGSEQEPALIVLRYDGAPDGPLLGFVGKAVTFDSGGISLKPGPKMSEMKFDMSGGAAVIEAIGAIARLRLPVRLVGVVGATENLPSGRAVKPGDIVTAASGKTIEVNNTDAEGRLVLADCLHHAVSLGAQQIVDLATLTGAVITALGSTHAGLMSNDDELAERIAAAGARSGEIVWRLPLHEEYDKLIEGRYGDLNNAPEERKAGTIVGATFLSHFVGGTPWAHLDIAGSAWDLGRAYAPKGASGYGVRLLVELARSYAPDDR